MATFTKQLTRITQNVMNPALAPRAVVAMSSPEPTIAADRIKPGPRCRSCPKNVVGAGKISLLLRVVLLDVDVGCKAGRRVKVLYCKRASRCKLLENSTG